MKYIFWIVLLWAYHAFGAENCSFDSAKQVIAKNKRGYSAVWTLDDQTGLYLPLQTSDKNYGALKAWISAHTKEDWRAFLLRHRDIVAELVKTLDPNDAGGAEFQKDISQGNKILAGLGSVHPLACLESIPYREYLKVVDLRKYPQEFSALIFKKDGKVKILGDFYFVPGTSEPTGVDTSKEVAAEAKRLKAAGWSYYAHLHDHTFVFSNPTGDLGGELAPSAPDLEIYSQEKPERAMISNGLDTIEFSRADVTELLRD